MRPQRSSRRGDHGSERPVDAVASSSTAVARHGVDELGVVRSAEADVVREDGGAEHVVVSMHGVDPVEQRNAEPRRQRFGMHRIQHFGPFGRGRPAWRRAAGAENGAERVALDVTRAEVAPLGLRHLTHLFGKRHALPQLGRFLGHAALGQAPERAIQGAPQVFGGVFATVGCGSCAARGAQPSGNAKEAELRTSSYGVSLGAKLAESRRMLARRGRDGRSGGRRATCRLKSATTRR